MSARLFALNAFLAFASSANAIYLGARGDDVWSFYNGCIGIAAALWCVAILATLADRRAGAAP